MSGPKILVGFSALGLLVVFLATGRGQAPNTAAAVGNPTTASACYRAFATAAAVDPMRDTHSDLFPAYSACASVTEWEAAHRAHPGAIDIDNAVAYARTVCAGNQAALGDTPICRAVNRPEPNEQSARGLGLSGQRGLLNVPLPEGARLIESVPGDPAQGIDPREEYEIDAPVGDIISFFDREMPKVGWARDGVQPFDTGRFYIKGRLMIGVLSNRDGGTFTLMGS